MAESREWAPPASGIPVPAGWPASAATHMALNGVGGFDWDLDRDRVHLDAEALRVLDVRPDEFDGDPLAMLSRLTPDDAAAVGRTIKQALAEGHASWGAYSRLTRRDGRFGWVRLRGRVVRDGDGRACRVIGIAIDATDELAQAAACLREEDRSTESNLVVEVTASLARAVTVRDVTAALTGNRRMDRLGIASLFLGQVEGGRVHVVSDAKETSWVPELQFTRIDDDYPMSEVVRTLTPRFITSPEEFARRYPTLWPHIEPLGASAAAYLPLVAQGKPIGALGLLYRHKTTFSPQERDLLIALGGSIAQSLQRAILFDQEHDIAQGLQTAMLPRTIPDVPGAGIAVRYRSARLARDIGGDWYDVVAVPGGRVAVVIGDVQGHDTHAAAVMGQLRIALRAYAAEGHPPATVMARASAFLHELDTDRFATCLYAEADPATGATLVVRAGHIDPLVRQADGTVRVLPTVGGLPLGLSAQFGPAEYPVTRAELAPGETFLMFTDGLVERPGADLDDGVRLLAGALRDGPCGLQNLADHLTTVMGEPGTEDDMALLLLRRDGDAEPAPARRRHRHVAPGDPRGLAGARAMVRDAMTDWGMPDRADEAALAADELITNALVHTDGGAVLTLRLLPDPAPAPAHDGAGPARRLRVEVHDLAADWPRRRRPGDGEPSGRGLLLVDGLADAWGVEPHGSGKSVWCEFHAPGACAPAPGTPAG
ncbi:SpoIIE family protein phosphatase [Streptomyces sp. NPDC088354]|uniref:SpoIIE family protein phosphatase n=1 Tax=unclassified Streptomyces TaxID=2593676 RepID=UPI0029A5092B|nr:SpoIIE family protein phosphatase [Streptomyces sp. MI02-7b]MDX3073863.1 SpoIIE family protein phosphatase [Streptomyces sp. MI02-7b]